MMELALRKMENRHRKGIGAQMYKESKTLSPARKTISMIDSLFKPVRRRERTVNQVKTNFYEKRREWKKSGAMPALVPIPRKPNVYGSACTREVPF